MVKGKVTHFEIPVDKMDRARKFYSDIFGWKITAMPGPKPGGEYTMAFGAKTDERLMITEVGVPADHRLIAPIVLRYPEKTPGKGSRKEPQILKWIR
ncbi:MAG: VOC family protein [Methanomassiliicoccales archaeon]|nr:VOC family protein [Methanomassiliicoccales archaeon]